MTLLMKFCRAAVAPFSPLIMPVIPDKRPPWAYAGCGATMTIMRMLTNAIASTFVKIVLIGVRPFRLYSSSHVGHFVSLGTRPLHKPGYLFWQRFLFRETMWEPRGEFPVKIDQLTSGVFLE